jgi:pimeloyl-ACP methyl ester carboxylesterase
MKTVERVSVFTSPKARARFLTVYEDGLERSWPTRVAVDVPTSFGSTRVYRSGQPDGIPVVLLPGAGGNALMWQRYVEPLGRSHPVIAIDPVGEPGASTQDSPVTSWSQWLGEVLAALSVGRAHLVGCSYGGWIAVQHALRAPEQVATLTLLDPAGFGRVSLRFMVWVIAGGLAGLAPRPVRRRAARWLRNRTLLDDDAMRLVAASMGFRRRLPVPAVLSDEDLAKLTPPTLVLLGERSQLYDPAALAQRLRQFANVELVPGAGHDLPIYDPELVIDRVLAFLDQ